jgi:uncharacterized protein with HEPN domain
VSRERWQQRVQDILDAIAEIQVFVADMDRDQFLADPKTLKAVTANLVVIGEAARHVPEPIVRQSSEIPWELMSGMRNRLVHGYYQVDPEIVWDTCQNDLPSLVDPLTRMLRENSGNP